MAEWFSIEVIDGVFGASRWADAAVQAALDAVPNPTLGVITHRGRGGSAGARDPRRPRPLIGAGSAVLPVPVEDGVSFEEPERRLLLVR